MRMGIKVGKALLVILFLGFVFIQIQQPKASKANYDTVVSNTMKVMEEYNLEKQDNKSIKKYLGLQPDQFESIEYYKSSDPMDVREIIIVKYKDDSLSDVFEQAVQARIDSQINAFDGYGAEQVEMLKKAKVSTNVNFAMYVTCEKSDKALSVYKGEL